MVGMTMTPPDDHRTVTPQAGPRFGPPTSANPLWRAVLLAGGLFCLSCLLWITAGFADQRAPGNRWLNHNGLLLVGLTGAASVVSALGAMLTDSLQTRRMQRTHAEGNAADPRCLQPRETAASGMPACSRERAAEPRS